MTLFSWLSCRHAQGPVGMSSGGPEKGTKPDGGPRAHALSLPPGPPVQPNPLPETIQHTT